MKKVKSILDSLEKPKSIKVNSAMYFLSEEAIKEWADEMWGAAIIRESVVYEHKEPSLDNFKQPLTK